MTWSPSSWKSRPARQQVEYDDPRELESALQRLSRLPPIVTSWEVEKLKKQLAEAGRGERFSFKGEIVPNVSRIARRSSSTPS